MEIECRECHNVQEYKGSKNKDIRVKCITCNERRYFDPIASHETKQDDPDPIPEERNEIVDIIPNTLDNTILSHNASHIPSHYPKSFWLAWEDVKISLESVFKKWPSKMTSWEIVKSEVEAIK